MPCPRTGGPPIAKPDPSYSPKTSKVRPLGPRVGETENSKGRESENKTRMLSHSLGTQALVRQDESTVSGRRPLLSLSACESKQRGRDRVTWNDYCVGRGGRGRLGHSSIKWASKQQCYSTHLALMAMRQLSPECPFLNLPS